MSRLVKHWHGRILLLAVLIASLLVLFPQFQTERKGRFDYGQSDPKDGRVYVTDSHFWSSIGPARGFLLTGPFWNSAERKPLPADYVRRDEQSGYCVDLGQIKLELCTLGLVTIIVLVILTLWRWRSSPKTATLPKPPEKKPRPEPKSEGDDVPF